MPPFGKKLDTRDHTTGGRMGYSEIQWDYQGGFQDVKTMFNQYMDDLHGIYRNQGNQT